MIYNSISNTPWERSTVTHPWAYWDDAFTHEELDNIIKYCEDKGLDRSKILGTPEDKIEEIEQIRRCDIKFHSRNNETAWIFDRLNRAVSNINNMFYGFDLNGYCECQYTSYNSAEKEIGRAHV